LLVLASSEKYADISNKLEEIGRMLGGWRKGLLDKQKNSHPAQQIG